MSSVKKQNNFPESFIFGVADADLQVIGEEHTIKHENSLPTMWAHCARESGKVFNHETPHQGVDRYHRFEEDIELIKALGVKHYRTSISMARTLNADGSMNEKAIQWYRQYFEALKRAGIAVYATLYHWELPQILSAKGGWASKETIDLFVKHCAYVVKALDHLIDEYFIINEHFCIVFLGHHIGIHAPFIQDLSVALQAGHNLLLAQGKAFRAIKQIKPNAKVSTVYNPAPVYADSGAENDLLAQKLNAGYSDWLLEPIYTGRYPEHMVELFKRHMPKIEPGDMETIKIGSELHSLGINYYFGQTVRYAAEPILKGEVVREPFEVRTGLGWPVYIPPAYPSGFYDLLVQIYYKYSLFGLNKIYITENGTAWPSEVNLAGQVEDPFRIEYIEKHLDQVKDSISAGVPVAGYFLWTLMDNYEWQEGYRPDSVFGLIHVDRQTLKRTPKSSYYWYQRLVQASQGFLLPTSMSGLSLCLSLYSYSYSSWSWSWPIL